MPVPQIQERIGETEYMQKGGEQPAVPSVEEHKEHTKERTKAYEQQAADAREYIIMLEDELQRIYAGILALMDENLIPSASSGEPKAFYSEKKDDYYRFLAERATGNAKRQAPMIQKVLQTVEAP